MFFFFFESSFILCFNFKFTNLFFAGEIMFFIIQTTFVLLRLFDRTELTRNSYLACDSNEIEFVSEGRDDSSRDSNGLFHKYTSQHRKFSVRENNLVLLKVS